MHSTPFPICVLLSLHAFPAVWCVCPHQNPDISQPSPISVCTPHSTNHLIQHPKPVPTQPHSINPLIITNHVPTHSKPIQLNPTFLSATSAHPRLRPRVTAQYTCIYICMKGTHHQTNTVAAKAVGLFDREGETKDEACVV